LGREAVQEVDQVESFGRLAKWAGQIDDAATAADLVGEGLSTMLSGRLGPVLFSLPEDVLDEPVPARSRVKLDLVRPAAPSLETVGEIIALLKGAQRPAILAGGGVVAANAQDDLVALSELAEVPVFAAWRRPTAFPNDHPHYLGVTGYGAASTVRPRLEKADALLVLGSRMNEVSSFDYRIPAARTKWAHVDLEPRSEARAGMKPATIALPADAGAFLRAAIDELRGYKAPRERAAAMATDRAAYLAASEFGEDRGRRGQGVDPAHVITTLQRVLSDDALLMSDAGNFGLWLSRGFRFGRKNGFLALTSGAMGYGLPAAIAASLCEPTRQVVALCGDGGFAMTMNELETAVRAGAKPVVLVFDNKRYGTIAMHQSNEGRANVATDLGAIDFAAVARAMGAQGGRVGRDVEFEPALRDALSAGRPAVIHLEIDPRWVTPDRYD
ncbi:MAG: thiamine pyrophosphate-dependent enzyme, partial [Chloroflexota bacterium]